MDDSIEVLAIKRKLAEGYIRQARFSNSRTSLRNVHSIACTVFGSGEDFDRVIEAIQERAMFLGLTGEIGELYA